MTVNILKNIALEKVDATEPSGAEVWTEYVSSWTAWNHVRTAMPIIATASFIIALYIF